MEKGHSQENPTWDEHRDSSQAKKIADDMIRQAEAAKI